MLPVELSGRMRAAREIDSSVQIQQLTIDCHAFLATAAAAVAAECEPKHVEARSRQAVCQAHEHAALVHVGSDAVSLHHRAQVPRSDS
jgi:hypothetical protein